MFVLRNRFKTVKTQLSASAALCDFMLMSMASITKALRIRASALKQSIYLSGDFPMDVRSFVQKRTPYFYHQSQLAPPNDSQPQYSSVIECCRLESNSGNIFIKDQLRLANVYPPAKQDLSTEDVGRILKFVRLDVVKRKLRSIPDACISYAQLLELCMGFTEKDEGRDIVNMLEQSGHILRIGKTVYLHPQQIARAIESVLPVLMDHSTKEEMRNMEKVMAEIDVESERQVRKELWCGLGFFSLHTAALLRLTFWELSWDIMEPICFYLTSFYFIIGYAFFIRTAREPTFESFYAARINIKQRKLMKVKKFNLERYRELHRICRPTLKSGDLIN